MSMNLIYDFFYRNNKEYATCLQCSKTVSASKWNTSNLISHFFRAHKSFYDSYKSSISNKKIKFYQPSVYVETKTEAISNSKQEEIEIYYLKFILTSFSSFTLTNNTFFHLFCNKLNPKLSFKKEKYFRTTLLNKYFTIMKSRLNKELEDSLKNGCSLIFGKEIIMKIT